MKKKLVSIFLSASFALSIAVSAFAAAAAPKVILDERTIYFADQQPVILEEENRTLVPVRGVFEAMGAKVEWNADTQTATMDSADNRTRVMITNNNKIMKVITFSSVLSATTEEITLDAEPRIIGDRTMVPLRAISEALDADVNWDEATQCITITTKQAGTSAPGGSTGSTAPVKDNRIKVSLTADKTQVKAGDTVTLSLDLSNITDKNYILKSVCAAIFYDNTKFEYVDSKAVMNGAELSNALEGDNAAYKGDSLKTLYIVQKDLTDAVKDGSVMTITFKALTDGKAEFVLSDRYTTDRGNDTNFLFIANEKSITIEDSKDLIIDTTPIKINE